MNNLIIIIQFILIFSMVGCADKGVYVGEKKVGKRHGQGSWILPQGKFVVECKDGKMWKGTLI